MPDTMIMILGDVGVGKSTFIDTAGPSLNPKPTISADIEPPIQPVSEYRIKHPTELDSFVTLVDTPGFHDYRTTDIAILKDIIHWMDQRSRRYPKATLGGIIYLHDINQARVMDYPIINPNRLASPPPTIFATVKWSPHSEVADCSREDKLKRIFKTPLYRFDNTHASAWALIDVLLASPTKVALSDVQKQFEGLIGHMPSSIVQSPPPNETLIMIFGETGVGKSTFINVAGPSLSSKAETSNGIESCTGRVSEFKIEHPYNPGFFVTLIDTPGFNDSDMSKTDADQLKAITAWLKGKTKQNPNATLSGIIYLHDISQVRVIENPGPGTMNANKLAAPPAIIFTTTKWTLDNIDLKKDQELREEKLKGLFKNVIFHQFFKSHASAWDLIDTVLKTPLRTSLSEVQEQLEKITKLPKPAKRRWILLTGLFWTFMS